MDRLTIDDYMKIPYPMVVDEDMVEGGYTIYFPDLKGCVTCTESKDKINSMAEDAKRVWLEASLASGYEPPLLQDN